MSENSDVIRFVADRLLSSWFPHGNKNYQDAEIWEEVALDDAEIAIEAYKEWLSNNE